MAKIQIRPISRSMTWIDRLYVPRFWPALQVTARHFFRNLFRRTPRVTVQYPDERVQYPDRFRGVHRLLPREDGSPRCTACFLCQTACPAACIRIVEGEHDDPTIEKYPVVFEIDELRCVVCGLCVEACPCDAIRMDTGLHPPPITEAEEGMYHRHDLLSLLGSKERQAGRRQVDRPPPTCGGSGRRR